MSETLKDMLTEVIDLRFQESLPGETATPMEVLNSLRRVRQRLDRVEAILHTVVKARGQLSRKVTVLEAEHQHAWDEAISTFEKRKNITNGEFVAPREKYAHADLATFATAHTLNIEKRNLDFVKEVESQVRMAHRSLDSLRQDHNTILRAIVVETTLER